MKTIYKYEIELNNVITVKMPIGAEILTVQIQNEIPCIWAKVDTEEKVRNYNFAIFATGSPIGMEGYKLTYINTFQLNNGALIFHLFQIK